MSNLVRDNELRALSKMQVTYDVMKTIFPNDKGIMESWWAVSKEVHNLISEQEDKIKGLDKQEE